MHTLIIEMLYIVSDRMKEWRAAPASSKLLFEYEKNALRQGS